VRPAARLAALIELLDEIEEGIRSGGAPADSIVNAYFRARRYAGSKDRRAISSHVYAILRCRELLLWLLNAAGLELSGRLMVLAYLARYEPEELEHFRENSPYAPAPLDDAESAGQARLSAQSLQDCPEHIHVNVSDWAVAGLKARFGADWKEAAAALNEPAPLDLRVNPLKGGSRDKLLNSLEGFEPTALSPLGMRSAKNVALGALEPYKEGLVEVQDEAAQLASLLVGAAPGMSVADLCAGAGGKSLAIAAAMQNRGRVRAFDIHARRLSECRKRAERAGVTNLETECLAESGAKRSEALAPHKEAFDRVVVDAPCSGTGTWRRSPDQRWRQDETSLKTLNSLQFSLLSEAATLVKPGGVLIYMTCSVLPAENEDVISDFLGSGAWKPFDYNGLWEKSLIGAPVETCALNPAFLQLSPHKHATDGFFLAAFARTND